MGGGKIAYNGVSFATPQAATLVYPILAPRANARFGEPLRGFDLVSPSGAIPTPLTGGAGWGGWTSENRAYGCRCYNLLIVQTRVAGVTNEAA